MWMNLKDCHHGGTPLDKKQVTNWPEKPKELNFNQVHHYREEACWCTYVLKQYNTVAASSLNLDDLNRFKFFTVTKKQLFSGCEVKKVDEGNMKMMEQRLKRHLEQCKSVIPFSLISQKCQELEKDLMHDTGADKLELCQKILKIAALSRKK